TEEELAAEDEADMAERAEGGEEHHDEVPHGEEAESHDAEHEGDEHPTPTEVESGFDIEQSEEFAPFEIDHEEHTVDETPLEVIAEEEAEQGVVDQQTAAEV